MTVDPSEMREQARRLRGEAAALEEAARAVRLGLAAEAMHGPAADRLRERLGLHAAAILDAATDSSTMAAALEQHASALELRGPTA